MRWLFLLLLAANLLFFSWNWFRNSEDQASLDPAVGTTQGAKGLVLLSELKPAEEDLQQRSNHPVPPSRMATANSPPAEIPATPAAVKSPAQERAMDTLPAPTKTGGHGEKLCYVLGPFASSSAVEELLKRTVNSPAIVERRWSRPQQRPGYWVHIPPVGSSKEARNIVQILSQAGISDVQLITSGEMKNAISLGIFSTMENARKRQNEAVQQGFEVVIDEVKIRKRRYWVALRGSGGRALSEGLLGKLIEDAAEAKMEKRSCNNLYH